MLWVLLALVAQTPEASIPVHPPARGDQMHPTAALTSEGLVVAWIDRRAIASEVMYAHSPDLTTFSAPYSLSGPAGSETIRPHAAARGDRAVVVWASAALGDHDVYAAISEDGGRTFAPPIVVAGGSGSQVDPRAVILDDGRIAIAYHDTTGSRVRVVTSDPEAHFGPSVIAGDGLFPAITAHSSTITVAWLGRDDAIFAAESLDRGATFEAPTRIDPPIGRKLYPRIASATRGWIACFASFLPAAEQSGTAVVRDDEYLDVLVATATATFTANEARALTQHSCDVAGDGDFTELVWIDHSVPNQRRVMMRSAFAPERAVSETGEVFHPSVVTNGAVTVVVFESATGGSWDVRATILRR